MRRVQAILITGPTASGKSRLAVELAERIGGVVINADSMQVYADLRILTARPGPGEEARAPHWLYGHIDGSEAYSAGRFVAEVEEALAAAKSAGKVPIFVGGTGLYFKALLEGLSPIPPTPEAVRRHWRAEAERIGPAELHALLAWRDGEMARRLSASDPQRIVRALEVLEATGRSLAHWQRLRGTPVLSADKTLRFMMSAPRLELHRRCEERFDTMLAAGALDEVRALRARGLAAGLPVMRALGVPPLLAHLAGDIDFSAAIAQAKAETRQYVKRQLTWAKSNFSSWNKLSAQETKSQTDKIIAMIDLHVDGQPSRP